MMGLRRELAYPSHRKRDETQLGMGGGVLKGRTRASTKKGSQHTTKALMMIPGGGKGR